MLMIYVLEQDIDLVITKIKLYLNDKYIYFVLFEFKILCSICLNYFQSTLALARKIYMEGIVKQATDSRYWDLWDHQKLSSELELKRRHLLELNQVNTSYTSCDDSVMYI